MDKKRFALFLISIGIGLCASLLFLNALSLAAPAGTPPRPPQAAGDYVLLAWNDLGMHCYNSDFQDLAVLPPYNTLWAQVVKVGDPPQIVTEGITVTYVFTDNTYSVGKSNFWTYAQQLFGLSQPLPDNIGLTGKGLAGSMDRKGDHFEAVGIPLTEYSDSAPTVRDPFQLATIRALDAQTGAVLAEAVTVAPVSTEMRCDRCHSDGGIAMESEEISPTGKVETNILALHDHENMEDYPAGHTGPLMDRRPVLCAECHASNALGATGVAGIPSLSNAMHEKHEDVPGITDDSDGCYNCHPGPQTQCLRDVMSQQFGMTCINCHGKMEQVARNPNPWLNEPRCDSCHSDHSSQDQPLYRMSRGHGGMYCESCHDSTHAIAPSRELKDGLKFMALQDSRGVLAKCDVCHATVPPVDDFPHNQHYHIYLPGLISP